MVVPGTDPYDLLGERNATPYTKETDLLIQSGTDPIWYRSRFAIRRIAYLAPSLSFPYPTSSEANAHGSKLWPLVSALRFAAASRLIAIWRTKESQSR